LSRNGEASGSEASAYFLPHNNTSGIATWNEVSVLFTQIGNALSIAFASDGGSDVVAQRNRSGTPVRVSVLAGLVCMLVVATAVPAFAAKPGSGGGGSSSTPTGNDISYPQCGSSLPSSPAFGIVGVNDGRANDLNPCLGPSKSYPSYTQSELYWAVASSTGSTPTGSTPQPKASLYVNTGDPGNVYNGTLIGDWPQSGTTPYGSCTTTSVTTSTGTAFAGENSPSCAWQYGYNSATQDAARLTSAADAINGQTPPTTVSYAPGSYPWWLDVETANTWQTGTSGQTMNVADLQGMIASLTSAGASIIGAYSTSSQWNQITGGTTSAAGSLYGIPDWLPGAKTLSGAESNCRNASFTGGRITVTQFSGHPDNDYAC